MQPEGYGAAIYTFELQSLIASSSPQFLLLRCCEVLLFCRPVSVLLSPSDGCFLVSSGLRGKTSCSVGFRTGGTCGHRMLAFHRSVPSFHFLLPTLLPLSCPFSSSSSSFIVPLPFVSGAGGEPQAGSDAASGAGGRPPRPGPRWVLGAATPEAGPGSPAPRPARPNLRRATGRCGWEKRETKGEALKAGLCRGD